MRTRVSALVLAGLISLASCGGSSGDTAKPVPTAGPETGDLLVRGVVTRDDKPVAKAKVWLDLWPEDEDAEVGEIIDLWSSKAVTTDSDGRYGLRLDPQHLTSTYFNGDYLNFDLHVFSSGKSATWSSTVTLIERQLWRSDEQSLPGDPVVAMSLDLGKPSITITNSNGDREKGELTLFDLPESAVPTKAG